MYRLVLIISTFLALETLCGSFVAAGTATPENEALRPLHVEIDRIVEAERVGPPTSICSDSEFLRRVYLDLAGKIPTAQEARDFLQDTRPDKRALLIEALLQEPHFDRNFMRVLDVMLMERRIEKVVSPGKFREFLRTSIEDRKPLDSLVREIIVADGAKDQQRPAARFLLDRAAEPHVLTRDVGRLFLGWICSVLSVTIIPRSMTIYRATIMEFMLFSTARICLVLKKKKWSPNVLKERPRLSLCLKAVILRQ